MLAIIKFIVILIATVFVSCAGVVYRDYKNEGNKEGVTAISSLMSFLWIAIPLVATIWNV